MRTSLIVLSLALFPLLACGQNARPVLADTNGVIRVGTVGSELTALNGTHVTTGTVAEARIDAALLRAATAATLYQGTNANLTTLGTLNGGALTNLNSTNLIGTVPTNVLPGALGTLSTLNGGGLLTNTYLPFTLIFTNIGTIVFTNLTPARQILIEAVGCGGPGGSGRRGAAGSVRSGGSGGGGGGYSKTLLTDPSVLWSNKFVIIIPPVPSGGGSVTTDDSNGTNGASSADTIVYVGTSSTSNWVLRARAGSPGVGGDADGSTGGAGANIGFFTGSSGGSSSSSGGSGVIGTAQLAGNGGAGGGAGGGITTGDVPSSGGSGGSGPNALLASTVVGPGGDVGQNGTNINTVLAYPMPTLRARGWHGAGGGGSQTNAVAGSGADGFLWGSGGGGGGASLNGYNSGAGGNGGPSAVWITFYTAFPAIAVSDWVGAVAQWTYDSVTLLKHLAVPVIDYAAERITK